MVYIWLNTLSMKYILCVVLLGIPCLNLQAQFQEEEVLWNSEYYHDGEVVLAADFNGDAKADYLFNSSAPDPDFLVLSSASGFEAPRYFDSSYDLRHSIVADYHNDGDQDLLFLSSSLLFVAENDGTGALSLTFHQLPHTVSGIYDMDQDGKLDLIGTSEPNIWYRNLGGFDNFEPVEHSCPYNFEHVLVDRDLNADGFNERIVRIGQAPKKGHLFIGYGDPQGNYNWSELTSMVAAGSLHRATLHLQDVDMDGDLDIWLNINREGLSCAKIYLLRNQAGRMSQEVLVYEPSGSIFCITRPITEVADVNGDGFPDLLMQRGNNDKLMSLINTGTGYLESGPEIDKEISTYRLVNYRSYLDEPKELLLATAGPITKSFRVANESLLTKFSIIDQPLGKIQCLSFADINGDQKKDIITFDKLSNRVYGLLTEEPFGYEQSQLVSEIEADEVYAVVFNNTGAIDLMAYKHNSLYLYRGPDYEDNGAFLSDLTISSFCQNLQAIDINQDGVLEYQINNNLISYGPVVQSLTSTNPMDSCLQVQQMFDFDGNLSFDLLQECRNPASISIALKQESGQYKEELLPISYETKDSVVAAYLNEDTSADLIHFDRSSGSIKFLLQIENEWQIADSLNLGTDPELQLVSLHLNKDGLSDIALYFKHAQVPNWQLSYLINQGEGRFGTPVLLKESNREAILYAEDLDSDGLDDIVFRSKDGSYLSYFLNEAMPIEEEDNGTVSVFPNPSQGQLYLPLSNADALVEYEIFDPSGRGLLEGHSRSLVNVATLQQGLYLIRWQIAGRVYQSKFVKK